MLFTMFGLVLALLLFFNFGLYFLGQLLIAFVFKEQNLRVNYNAKWALITGASSGIEVLSLNLQQRVCVRYWKILGVEMR